MDSRIYFSSLLVTFLFLAIAPLNNLADEHENEHSTSIPFTYRGSNGPSNWGKLSPNFTTCSYGKLQSPVNIYWNKTVINKDLKPLIRLYKPANATLTTNGIVVGIHYESDCGPTDIDDKKYFLKQMHWHSPSEHRIDGVQYPLELHQVHQLEDGSYSVVAILYKYGNPDPVIAKLQESLRKLAEKVKTGDIEAKVPLGTVDVKLMKRNSRRFFRYIGSLTTPPCTENVIWNIMPMVRTVSRNQVEALKAPLHQAFKNNSRPVQFLNGRKVQIAPRLNH